MLTNLFLPPGLLYAATVGRICSAASSSSRSALFFSKACAADVPYMRRAAASRRSPRRREFTCGGAPPPPLIPPSCSLSGRCQARGGYYRGDLIKAQHFDDFAAVCCCAFTSAVYQHSYVLHMSGPLFDRLNPFKGSASADPEGFRVSDTGTMGCPGILLTPDQRKASLKSHVRGQLLHFLTGMSGWGELF